jgi:nucleoside-diphosphate-sugar epimerase
VQGVTRTAAAPITGVSLRAVGEIGPDTDWIGHLTGINIVVHLATSAHRPVSAAVADREAEASAALARAAKAAGVRRLVHVSSIRAVGAMTAPGERLHDACAPSPQDAYGRAKLAVERAIGAAAGTRLELVILRPPLVYGPGVKGNFRLLIRLAASGIPLPLARLETCRSLIFIDNLIDLLALACIHPAAPGRILLARDAADLTISEVLQALGMGLGRPVRLFPVPSVLFAGLAVVPVLGIPFQRLTRPLLVDDSATRSALGWMPAVVAQEGLAITARAHLRRA